LFAKLRHIESLLNYVEDISFVLIFKNDRINKKEKNLLEKITLMSLLP